MEDYTYALIHFFSCNGQRAFVVNLFQCVFSIDNKIEEDLLYLSGVNYYGRQFWI